MAPPKKPPCDKRSELLKVRLTPDELTRIRRAATKAGNGVSAWVRWMLLEP